MHVIGIDPGPEYSAWAMLSPRFARGPESATVTGGMLANGAMLDWIYEGPAFGSKFGVEMIASYGMPVGREVFKTCYWIGRFAQHILKCHNQLPELVYRKDVKLFLCGNVRAKDSNVMHAIQDLYGGSRRKAVGIKAKPGPLYGFKADMWAALGVALTYSARLKGES